MAGITGRTRRMTGPILAAGLIAALLISGAGMLWFTQARQDSGLLIPANAIGGPFALLDGDGRAVTDATYRGKYLLVYFGYTFCPDVCPTTLNQVATAMDKLGPQADRVQPLFITVDPRRDKPAVVKQYAAAFSPRLIGLTGSPEQIATVAKEYRVYYAEHRTGPGPDEYSMDHSSILYLMGPDGKFIAPIRADEGGDAIAADISRRLPAG